MAGGEEPDAVLKAMRERVAGTMVRFKVPQGDALAFSGNRQEAGDGGLRQSAIPDQFPAKKN